MALYAESMATGQSGAPASLLVCLYLVCLLLTQTAPSTVTTLVLLHIAFFSIKTKLRQCYSLQKSKCVLPIVIFLLIIFDIFAFFYYSYFFI